MTAPGPREPHNDFVARHVSLDDRLEAAFERYDQAFQALEHAELPAARLDLSLLLWRDEYPPREVAGQLALDGATLLRDTPPLS